jgi:coenzyme Q-binding protein COQ10
MPRVIKNKLCDISQKNAYEIVKDFEKYPEFLPWCGGSRLKSRRFHDDNIEEFTADLIIKYKFLTEVFTTKVICNHQNFNIDIHYLSGPFHHLHSYWRFHNIANISDQCNIEFMIDFSVKSGTIQSILSLFFEQAMNKMITAFDERFKKQKDI